MFEPLTLFPFSFHSPLNQYLSLFYKIISICIIFAFIICIIDISLRIFQEIFLFNNRLQNTETEGAISSLRKQLAQDDEIVSLRESIRSKSDKKVLLGTESVNELVRDINAVSMARAQRAQHEIQLLKEIYKWTL